MVTSFTGYADDISHVIYNFHTRRFKFGRKSDKYSGKIVGPHKVHGACFYQLQGPLALGGARAPPITTWNGDQDHGRKVKGRGLVEHCGTVFHKAILP